jgi:hypothetical protein
LAASFWTGSYLQWDIQESLRWSRLAAKLGDGESLEVLGLCSEKRIGTDQDLAAAAASFYGRAVQRCRQSLSDSRFSGDSRVVEECQSFVVWNGGHPRSIDSIVSSSNLPVRLLFASGVRASEIVRRVRDDLQREGFRCLDGADDPRDADGLCLALKECQTINLLLSIAAELDTRATFLYCCVNQFLREYLSSDPETGRDLRVYIWVVRECFCIRTRTNPFSEELPAILYRGANFSIEDMIEYAPRPGAMIRW